MIGCEGGEAVYYVSICLSVWERAGVRVMFVEYVGLFCG